MELDELKQRWEATDRRLDAILKINTRLLQSPLLDRAQTALRRLTWLISIELAFDLVLAMCLGAFNAAHWHRPRFLVPGAALHIFMIAIIIQQVRQLVMLGQLDYAAPIIDIQKRLVSLRAMRIRFMQWVLVSSFLLWPLLLIVGLKAFLHIDAYIAFGAKWLVSNAIFGAIVIGAAFLISRRFADRMDRSPLVQRFMRDLAGYNLNSAEKFLASVREFEQA